MKNESNPTQSKRVEIIISYFVFSINYNTNDELNLKNRSTRRLSQ